jgi:hypothetical protein
MFRRSLFIAVFFLLLVTPVTLVYNVVYTYPWIFLGSDPVGETTPSGDITGMYFYNDGYYAYFNETLRGASDVTEFTYAVYLNKPFRGIYPVDFRLVYSSTGSKLEKWDGTKWVDFGSITVTTSASPNSITFKVSLSSIANPSVQQDTGIIYVNTPKSRSVGKQWVNLVYGSKNVVVGNVSFSMDDNNFYVETFVDPKWEIDETHMKVSMDPFSWSAPGQWPYQHEFNQPIFHDSYTIPFRNIGHGDPGTDSPFGVGTEDAIFVMVQAAIKDNYGNDESAYAYAFKVSGPHGDWAIAYISHEVIPELPWPMPVIFVPAVVATVYVLYNWRFKSNDKRSSSMLQ